ncbi:MAG: hypothetical protein SNH57_00695 [Rikenellaceae bacterium]
MFGQGFDSPQLHIVPQASWIHLAWITMLKSRNGIGLCNLNRVVDDDLNRLFLVIWSCTLTNSNWG